MKTEHWKPVPGYETYLVSPDGTVYNTARPNVAPKNQVQYNLYRNGKKQSFRRTALLKLVYPYEWIKDLADDEEAKPVRDCPGYYVTSKGRFFSSYYYKWLTPTPWNRPPFYYYVVHLKGPAARYVHTLVGRHFLPDWRPGLLILHKDETLPYPQINAVSNLWVGTHGDNVRDAIRKGRLIPTFGRPL